MEGTFVCSIVGWREGNGNGESVGLADGGGVGAKDGMGVGEEVGNSEGAGTGTSVGFRVATTASTSKEVSMDAPTSLSRDARKLAPVVSVEPTLAARAPASPAVDTISKWMSHWYASETRRLPIPEFGRRGNGHTCRCGKGQLGRCWNW